LSTQSSSNNFKRCLSAFKIAAVIAMGLSARTSIAAETRVEIFHKDPIVLATIAANYTRTLGGQAKVSQVDTRSRLTDVLLETSVPINKTAHFLEYLRRFGVLKVLSDQAKSDAEMWKILVEIRFSREDSSSHIIEPAARARFEKALYFPPLLNGVKQNSFGLTYLLTGSKVFLEKRAFSWSAWQWKTKKQAEIVEWVHHFPSEWGTRFKVFTIKADGGSNEWSPSNIESVKGQLHGSIRVDKDDWADIARDARLKFCLRIFNDSNGNDFFEVCRPTNRSMYKSQQQPGVFAGATKLPKRGVWLPQDKANELLIILTSGYELRFQWTPAEAKLVDVVKASGTGKGLLKLSGTEPNSPNARSIGKEIWELDLAIDPRVKATGPNGRPGEDYKITWLRPGPADIRMNLTISDNLPTEDYRVYLASDAKDSTYLSGSEVKGNVPPGKGAIGSDLEVIQTSTDQFSWEVPLDKRGYDHDKIMTVMDGTKKFHAQYKMHHGLPIELSARLSGVVSSDSQLAFLGEAAGSFWLENLLGWQDYYLSERRWGIFANYFQSSSLGSSGVDVTSWNANLKYRFTPGVWNRDESVGAILAYQNIKYRGVPGDMTGVGMFWARSMPDLFDKIFNFIPIFRYPKWVDMEAIYYLSSQDPSIKLAASYSLMFHGKMFVSPEFFLESGLGVKRFSYTNLAVQRQISSLFVFGMFGAGYNF